MIERHQVQLDGLRLSYLEQGEAARDQKSQPTLVLLHGLMGCAETFVPMMQEFAEDQHVVALDFAGAGQSERRAGADASMAATATHVQRFLAALGLERPVILGHSYGGAVALRVAAINPQALCSLVLIAPAHPYFKEANPLVRFYLSLPGRLFAYTMPWYPRWMQMMGLRRMAGPKSWDTPERLKPYRENMQTPGTMKHLLTLLKTWSADFDGLGRLLRRPLATPALFIWGDCDRAVPVGSAAELRAHMLKSELKVLRGVGHRPAEERAMEVARLTTRWMQSGMANVMSPKIYSANSAASQERIASLMTPSFEAGD
jgi:pimeloyl-ACP methyl ester carboxylesterase